MPISSLINISFFVTSAPHDFIVAASACFYWSLHGKLKLDVLSSVCSVHRDLTLCSCTIMTEPFVQPLLRGTWSYCLWTSKRRDRVRHTRDKLRHDRSQDSDLSNELTCRHGTYMCCTVCINVNSKHDINSYSP